MWLAIPAIIVLALFVYEYRLRRPDQLILFESAGVIGFRKARWYPRHFSLAIPGTTHLMEIKAEASAKGSMPVIVKMAVSVAAARETIAALVRAGGWNSGAVAKASKELETLLYAQTKEFTELSGLEDLSTEALRDHLMQRAATSRQHFGLEIIALTVQAIDPVDASIAEALRQRESARILEQTESLNQQARVVEAEARLRADEQIAAFAHTLELRKLDLKKAEQEQEALLAQKRVEDELKRSRMKLDFDREEMNLLKDNPQLLLLTPQAARLAEASQTLKNARTVVSLAPGDAESGTNLLGLFQLFLENVMHASPKPGEKKTRNS
jgi:hypothetical protein